MSTCREALVCSHIAAGKGFFKNTTEGVTYLLGVFPPSFLNSLESKHNIAVRVSLLKGMQDSVIAPFKKDINGLSRWLLH